MPLTQALVDIWREILDYFKYDLEDDDATEVDEKREILLAVAFTLSSLTDMALNALWNAIDSLRPVVHVVNSCVSSSEDAFLRLAEDHEGEGYWELRRPLDNHARSRAHSYLSRIRCLHLDGADTTESTLWPILMGCLCPTSPLLPNLQDLVIKWEDVEVSVQFITSLIAVLSPSLDNLTITNSAVNIGAFPMLLHLLKSRECKLETLNYYGTTSPDLLFTIKSLKSLRHLYIRHPDKAVRRESSVDFPELLEPLASLRTLVFDLRFFPSADTLALHPVYHSALQNLTITGEPGELQDFLLSGIASPSLRSLSLRIHGEGEFSWKIICERAASNFPNIRHFSLNFSSSEEGPLLSFRDIAALLPKPITAFGLLGAQHNLTTTDILTLIKAWQHLESLVILCDEEDQPFFDATLLVSLAEHTHLKRITLRWDLESLVAPLSPSTSMTRGYSSVNELGIYIPKNFPVNLREKTTLAQNLLILSPKLNRLKYLPDGPDIWDLEELIQALRAAANRCGCRS